MSDTEPTDSELQGSATTSVRGTQDFITQKLAAALDRCKISDRNAMYILMTAAEALGHNIENLILNRSSLRDRRRQFRLERQEEIKEKFALMDSSILVVHWDGKLLPATVGVETVDRLAIIVTYDGEEKLLGVPGISTSSGADQAQAVYETLEKWSIVDRVQAMCFDTTASNTGRLNGACTNIEKLLERDLLYLPCRHHIFELVLRGCFDTLMVPTSGPDVLLFNRFRENWSKIDTTKYSVHKHIQEATEDVKASVLKFLNMTLNKKQPRADYRELLELTMLFFGSTSSCGISFRVPGAVSHARWMAKAIYAFKIHLLRAQFRLSKREDNGLQRMCIFLMRTYVQAWFSSTSANEAPYHDFNFLCQLVNYPDKDISKATAEKFRNHLWYLSPENVAFSFFDDNIPMNVKEQMAVAIFQNNCDEEPDTKRIIVKKNEVSQFIQKNFSELVSKESQKLFVRFNIDMNFLKNSPSTWENDHNYQKGLNIFKKMKIVNDAAERGVKLIHEFNNILTKNEEEKQFILQVVEEHRKEYPSSTKSALQI